MFRINKPEIKDQRVNILITQTEWVNLDDAAKENNTTRSEFIRSLLRWYSEEKEKKRQKEEINKEKKNKMEGHDI